MTADRRRCIYGIADSTAKEKVMNNAQALEILTQVAAQFRGTLQEHQQIQSALALAKAAFDKADAPATESN